MKFTVDASIVVKWYISENRSDEARLLLGNRLVGNSLARLRKTVSASNKITLRQSIAEDHVTRGS